MSQMQAGGAIDGLSVETSLENIDSNTQPLSGAGAAGQRELTLANTWYSVPSTVPASPYLLVVSKEIVAGTVRWAFANSSAPSATYGNKLSNNDLVIEVAANEVVYFGSSNATDTVNWTTKII